MTPLPCEALRGVVARPDVVRRQRVDTARIRDQVARCDFGPCADAHAVRLRQRPVATEEVRGRLAVCPHALLERALELRVVGLADEAVGLVVECRVEEEPVVLDLEVAVFLANSALTESQQLLAFGESAHSHGPFFECNRHMRGCGSASRLREAGLRLADRRAPSKRSICGDASL